MKETEQKPQDLEKPTEDPKDKKEFTPEDKKEGKGGSEQDKLDQEKVNQIVSSRLSDNDQKWEKKAQEMVDKAIRETEERAKMTADQKAEADRKKHDDEIEAQRLANLTDRNELEATKQFLKLGLPEELVSLVVDTDTEKMQKKIESFDKAFKDAVSAGVKKSLEGEDEPIDKGDNHESDQKVEFKQVI